MKFTEAPFFHSNLGLGILWRIVLFSIAVTLVSTSVQLYREYTRNIDDIRQHIEQIRDRDVGVISNLLWNVDKEQLSLNINGLLHINGIEYIEVESKDIGLVKAGILPLKKPLKVSYLLQIKQGGEDILLGQLHIYASKNYALQNVKNSALLILVSHALLIFFVSGFMVVLIHYMVTRHLSYMAGFLQKMDMNSLDNNLELPHRKHEQQDEIDSLSESVNKMINGLRKSRNELNEHQLYLENRVQERTAELAKLSTFHKAILDTAPTGIITFDHSGTLLSANSAMTKLFVSQMAEITGQSIERLVPDFLSSWKTGTEGELLPGNRLVTTVNMQGLVARRKDGSEFPVEIDVSGMMVDGKEMFVGLIHDITERKKIDNMKDEFVSTVSHELRTPLTSISGALELIASGVLDDNRDEMANMLDVSINNTRRLLLLVNDILDLQKIEAGELEMQFEKVDLNSIITASIKDNQTYASKHGVRFIYDHDNESVYVSGDRDRLQQVMNNLLSNAAKFSPANEDVEVMLSIEVGMAKIAVTDHGPGIPEEFREKLFEKFTQHDSSDNRQHSGTGLGLSIARSIIEKHHGQIDFTAETGKGTTMFFLIPLAD